MGPRLAPRDDVGVAAGSDDRQRSVTQPACRPQQQAEAIWQARHVQLKEDARPVATRQVRISLILEELVKREAIEITDADIDAHFEKMATDLQTSVKNVKNVYKKNRRMEELKFQLSTSRMLDRLLEIANVKEEKKKLKA